MYSESITSAQLERASRDLPFRPERHSPQECQKNKRHFTEIVATRERVLNQDTGERELKLFPDEIRWIENERLLCQWDYCYFATRYGVILGWDGQLQVFSPNIAQRIIWDIHAEMEAAGQSIEIQELKARQLGVSTDTELKVAHRVQFHPYTNAVTASSDPGKSAKMAEMMTRCWEHQPWFLMPRRTRFNVGELIEFGDLHSGVSIQHGAQFTGIARGDTPTVVHASEIGDFINAEELIEASLFRAVHPSRRVFLVLEGTGAGRTNWWYRKWQFSKANWPLGRSRLRPVFLPWYVGNDIYPTSTWLRTHPIPKDWHPEDATVAHAGKAKEYVERNDLLRKYLGNGWTMPPEQMWFWEVTRAEYKAAGTLSKFYQEMASDDLEAFQPSGLSVFDAEITTAYRERIKEPLGVYGLRGPTSLIQPKHQPNKWEINPDLPIIPIDNDFKLVPLRYQGISSTDPIGKIFLWEFPDKNEDYGLGVDPCNGVGSDRAALEMLRKGTIHRNDAQVAEYVNPWLNSTELVPFVHALAKYFSRRDRQVKLVIEQAAGGNLTQLELRKMGWSNFHVSLRQYNQKILDRGRSGQIGWVMHQSSRNDLITKLMEYLRNGLLDINSPWFVDEMGDLQADENTQKIAAERGAHDDRIIGVGMPLFSLHDLEIRSVLPSIAQQRAEAQQEEAPAPRWSPGYQGMSDFPGSGFSPVSQFKDDLLADYEPEDSWTT